ncbi:hypothetical protein E2562_032187 [Oryza meyeriana var. granulata]|uniref:Ubiquitin-like domain-containing protein n=1 Tax=Oryza meyeriana var. granulata TaxID=110450 RepID=A0A6G1F0D6_9ORYZ|nr:hypothetical protein E2562_032187 [Oryza meyeriana var. granulata]
MKRRAAMDSHHEQRQSLKIYVKMMKTVTLDVNHTDTVDQIKSKLSAIEGIDKSEQEIFFAGMHLKNEDKLADYSIMTNSSVDLYVTDGVQISVKIPSVGKTIKLNMRKSNSIADVKAEIEQEEGILVNKQILMYAGRQLEDNHMLSQCDLRNDQTLHVLVCPNDEQILTRMQSGVGVALTDSQMLQDQHVKNNDTFLLQQNVQFFVKSWEGKTLTMVLKTSDTGKDIMDRAAERLLIKESLYYLCHGGRVLSPGDTLRMHNVESNSTIYICLRNSGMVEPKTKK